MQDIWEHLGISAVGAAGVAVSSAVLYLVLTAVLRVYGQQLLGGVSASSLAVMTLLGAIAARAALGGSPTMAGGLVAIGTLLLIERSLGRMAGLVPQLGFVHRSPALLMVGDRVREDELRRSRMSPDSLWSLLRQQGVTSCRQLRLVVLEERGRLTVVRAGERIDPRFLAHVRGAAEVPADWLEPVAGG